MNKVELSKIEWYRKVSEALQIAFVDIGEGRFPRESHMEVIRALHPIYFNGSLPLYKSKQKQKEEKAEQQGLFDDKTADKT